VKEGHRYRSLHAAGPLPPRCQKRPSAARAPRDFASETFRGFCGRARGRRAGGRGDGGIRREDGEDGGWVLAGRRGPRGGTNGGEGLGGKTTVFPLIERLARGGGARRGGAEGRITCSNYLFLLRSASPCLAPASGPRGPLAATCWKSFLASTILPDDGLHSGNPFRVLSEATSVLALN